MTTCEGARLTSHPIAQCPITGGCPTTMSQEDFDYKCEYRRNRQKVKGHYSHKYCQVCDRVPPKELTIEDIEQKEVAVANQENSKVCEQCGKESGEFKKLKNCLDKVVCPSCALVRGAVNVRPEIVKAVMEEFGHHPVSVDQNIEHWEGVVKLKTERITELKQQNELLHKEILSNSSKIEKLNMLLSQASHEGVEADHSPMDKLAIGIMNETILGISPDLYRELKRVAN